MAGAYASQLVTDVEEQLGAAGKLLWAGDVERARAGLDAVIDADDDPVAHLLRGFANFMDDRLQEACRDWEAAFQGFRRAGDFEPAARAALLLAETHTASLGHEAAGQGWLGRARRLLDRIGPCVGHGWYEIAVVACTRPDIDDLLESADRALDIALEFGDPDLEIRALADGGLALVSQGRTREGFARLDEALAAITGGQLRDPSIAGNAFCSMLASCDRSGDLRRAEEWNRLIDELVLERLGGRPRILHTHCRAAYGSVLFSAGRWREAEEVMIEALGPDASRALLHRVAITARLAELRIDQGRIEEAAQLVEPHADELEMCSPRARIHLGRAEHDLAVAVAGRALRELVGDAVRRGPLLAVVVQADLGRDDPDSAERAAADLTALADRTESPALVGEAQLARRAGGDGPRRSRRRRALPERRQAELRPGRAAAAGLGRRRWSWRRPWRPWGTAPTRSSRRVRRSVCSPGSARNHSSTGPPRCCGGWATPPGCGPWTAPRRWAPSPGGRPRCSP